MDFINFILEQFREQTSSKVSFIHVSLDVIGFSYWYKNKTL